MRQGQREHGGNEMKKRILDMTDWNLEMLILDALAHETKKDKK